MRSRKKGFLLILFILFLTALASGQEKTQNDGDIIADPAPVTVFFNISVWSSRKGYLKNLTYKDFEVYDEKVSQRIEFFIFDELTNQYTIGFYPDVYPSEEKWHNVKIKVNLSSEQRKEYGKIFVRGQNRYYPNPPVVNEEDGYEPGIPTDLIAIHASVTSGKKGCLENLTAKNFEIYDEKTVLKIEFVDFEKVINQYVITFIPPGDPAKYDWRRVKVKVKLSAEEQKECGKISVNRKNGYYPNQN
jgi:hypothetical protein